ncbi:phosphatase PAP2 family protein [Mycobacterium sp. CVI_P3]|uniref:Phosphatase PAP2 family protein n=1 Tax=Mycobacterium pinniadriaticum TaxID=2994102 RepID=A0ABT3SQW3_9MYCO|nr:phosphatase PAP2 family protein [Mycobacterium pinniadriaticum]MCX2934805.1 phosphatase PAP2 family protein [Mycobacterium pinniadriaticum]MCX2941227.1 phosphatase PAP2 family protein [Mycobacterium pinniadriaticum]
MLFFAASSDGQPGLWTRRRRSARWTLSTNRHPPRRCATLFDIAPIALTALAVLLGAYAFFIRGRLALVLLSAGLFTLLAAFAAGINADWLTQLDTSVETWFGAHRSPRWRVDANGSFRLLGTPGYVASAAVVFGGLLSLRARSVIPIVLVVGSVGVGVLVEQTFKMLVTRTSTTVAALQHRPLDSFAHSFPSGHVTGSAALFGMVAVCLAAGCGRAAKAVLGILAVTAVVFVAFLAVYVEAHTFTDVAGGMILGGAIVSLGAASLGEFVPKVHQVDANAGWPALAHS